MFPTRRQTAKARQVLETLESRVLLATPTYVNGLAATYWDNYDFSGPSVSRIDAAVNFNWRFGSRRWSLARPTGSPRSPRSSAVS